MWIPEVGSDLCSEKEAQVISFSVKERTLRFTTYSRIIGLKWIDLGNKLGVKTSDDGTFSVAIRLGLLKHLRGIWWTLRDHHIKGEHTKGDLSMGGTLTKRKLRPPALLQAEGQGSAMRTFWDWGRTRVSEQVRNKRLKGRPRTYKPLSYS